MNKNYVYFCDKETFKKEFVRRVEMMYTIDFKDSTPYQQYMALGEMLHLEISDAWKKSNKYVANNNLRKTYYFSMEFLLGRMITNNIMAMGVRNIVEDAFSELGLDINEVEHQETDAGLGNGGLGRLAACFLDSSASLGLPVYGNCIRYRYGFFEQGIKNGYQVEHPDRWLRDIHVWEIRKEHDAVEVPFFGHIEINSINGKLDVRHIGAEYVKGVPYDVPVLGDNNGFVTTLRLWSAEPASTYPDNAFEYHKKLRDISSMLYPSDSDDEGKILRLKQQYFFVACGVKCIVRDHLKHNKTIKNFHEKICFQINDTHPALIVAELMRILIDEEHLEWDEAWNITTHTCCYTNHTILSEALEKWPVNLFRYLLPRIYTICEEINRRLMINLEQQFGKNSIQYRDMPIIKNDLIYMANLAIVGSYSVNGVAALHTEILKNQEMVAFNEAYPNKFNNKTNGVTHRRWLIYSNPELADILDEYIGLSWRKDMSKIAKLEEFASDKELQNKIFKMKQTRKLALANKIYKSQGISIDVNSIFDVQVKRLHEYKRQLMNALKIMYEYNRLKTDHEYREKYYPKTYIFGAKAAPSYYFAKKVIKLINAISDKVNNDTDTNKYLKVVFVVNYNVTYAETIVPACDISEQISTASKEASGTSNMKFMMNGGITLGTLDGANCEINDLVGTDNILIFGMTSKEVNEHYKKHDYNPKDYYNNDYRIKMVLDQLINGFFNNVDKDEFRVIYDTLLNQDSYFILKDFDDYVRTSEKATKLYFDRETWLKMSIINIAKSGYFTTDRTILEYNNDIWHLDAVDFSK